MPSNAKKGDTSVREAGRKGGQSTAERHGRQFYHQIGVKGGNRVRELINKGKKLSEQDKKAKFVDETYEPIEKAEHNLE